MELETELARMISSDESQDNEDVEFTTLEGLQTIAPFVSCIITIVLVSR